MLFSASDSFNDDAQKVWGFPAISGTFPFTFSFWFVFLSAFENSGLCKIGGQTKCIMGNSKIEN